MLKPPTSSCRRFLPEPRRFLPPGCLPNLVTTNPVLPGCFPRGEQGVARPEVLRALLASTDRIVQEIDSVEYGLTDIQEYYANTGAMKAAAETLRDGRKVREGK